VGSGRLFLIWRIITRLEERPEQPYSLGRGLGELVKNIVVTGLRTEFAPIPLQRVAGSNSPRRCDLFDKADKYVCRRP
jgi:hypothetical protein